MDFELIIKGVVIGFSIAAPVGPIGVLCIRRTLGEGRLIGFITGLGAASADAVYGAIAAFGLTAVSTILVDQVGILRLVGGGFLLYLGVRTLRAVPVERSAQAAGGGLFSAFGSTFLLTLTNPMTILSFAAVFAGIGVIGGGYSSAVLMVGSIFVGSAAWWLLLSGGVSLMRSRFNNTWMVWVNRFSGLVIAGFGIYQLIMLLENSG